VYGLDTCVRKPLLVTGGGDKTIRIWNYQDNSTVVIKKFTHEVYSVAMHPNGLHLVVGFQDKLRFMNILGNDIREAKSFHVRNCSEVKFSNGGQFFAAVHGNVINVYSTYTLQQTVSLRGHSGKVRSVFWVEDDTRLISTGMDGAIYEYTLANESKVVHHYNKACEFTSVVHDGKSVYAVSTDNMIREFADSEMIGQFEVGDVAVNILEYAPVQKMLFSGLADGGIRVSVVPGIDTFADELYCHEACITRACLINDESLLITISDDGILCIFEVRDREGSRLKRDTKYSEEILIAANDLEDKNNNISELKGRVTELKSDNEYEQRKKALEYTQRLTDQASGYSDEIRKKDEKIVQMRTIIDQTKTELDQKMEELAEEHILELSKKEKESQDKITGFLQQIQHFKSEFNLEREELLEKFKENEEVHNSEVSKLSEQHEDEQSMERQKYDNLKAEFEKAERLYIERIKQIEEDRDKEIEKLKVEFTERAKALQHSISGLSGDRKAAVADRDKMNIQLQQIMKDGKAKDQKLKELKDRKNHFETDALNLKNDNREREDTIVEKEKKIFELKRQNQELEKFKFVLQYKITTLEEEIRPNKEKIHKLRHEMKEMEKQLDQVKESNEQKIKLGEDLRSQIGKKNKDIHVLRNKLKDSEVFKTRIRSEIHDVVQNIQEPKKLKEDMKLLYQKHVNKTIEKQGLHFDILSEYERQKNYLDKTVESLKNKLVKATETSKTETNRVIQENMELIKEINMLRKDVKMLHSRLRDKEENNSGSRSKSVMSNIALTPKLTTGSELSLEEARRNIEMQKITIHNLIDKIEEMESDLTASSRPTSREKLPPMDGFTPSVDDNTM
jgi:WD40 repeat protein